MLSRIVPDRNHPSVKWGPPHGAGHEHVAGGHLVRLAYLRLPAPRAAPAWERRLSNPPPPESPRPDGTPSPVSPSPAEQVSGQPWSSPSGDPLSSDPLS